ncbi:PIN domain-containing protein [Microcoleus sp.]|uniref:PIN domain-containing protein n=1 Tax=Microcoleus sp. TaxID=44472 RepID=UPI0035264991
MASNPIALYDACVLYSAPLRDLLMQLALTDLFQARWTDEIHDEWIRNVLKNRPDLTIEQLTRTKDLMNRYVRDCLVTGYEWIIPSLNLPDPNDRHILAAAIKSYCFRLHRNDLTAENTEDTEGENRVLNNSDATGFDIRG